MAPALDAEFRVESSPLFRSLDAEKRVEGAEFRVEARPYHYCL
jgi:hypothetical protein